MKKIGKGTGVAAVVSALIIVALLAGIYMYLNSGLSGFSVESIAVGNSSTVKLGGLVYVASTLKQQVQGFQGVSSFGSCNWRANATSKCVGMLFAFGSEARQCFWMHDTPMPLQQDWISANGTVTYVYQGIPYDNTAICSNATYVLETYPNVSITVGDTLLVLG